MKRYFLGHQFMNINIILATSVMAVSTAFIPFLSSATETVEGHRELTELTANQGACPSAEEIRPLLALGSVYLGEVHGTNEVPALVGCLVDATLASGVKPLVVSLELPGFARNTKTLTWSGSDGRTSKAMAKLVEHLEFLESAKRIVLDFQITGYEASDEVMNHEVGMHLRDLARKSRVIALGGSFHSQRKNVLLPSLHVKPAGSYVGSAIKTVFVDSTGKGHAWFCSKICGEHIESNATTGDRVGQLMDGAAVGHDYIYKIGPFTSSSPAVERPVQAINTR
jgi:hypothetical protein